MTKKKKKELEDKQWEVAMSGDTKMLIWLGKQYLAQSDKQDENWVRPISEINFEGI